MIGPQSRSGAPPTNASARCPTGRPAARRDHDPAVQVSRAPSADACRAGPRAHDDLRAHDRASRQLLGVGAAVARRRHPVDARDLGRQRGSRVLADVGCRRRRQLGHDLVLPRRPRGVVGPPGPDRRSALLPPPAHRAAATGASATRDQARVRGSERAGHRLSGAAARRLDPHRRHAVAVDLGLAAAGAIREGADDDRGHRRAQRAAVPRADARHDAPVRAAGGRARGLAPVPDRAGAGSRRRRRGAAARHRVRRVRPRRLRAAPLEGHVPQPGADQRPPRALRARRARRRRRADAVLRGRVDDLDRPRRTPPVAGRLDCRDIPDMVPILSTLASRARGRTALSHVSHVRLKESDRVASMLQLRKMGADSSSTATTSSSAVSRNCTAPSCRRSTTTGS